MKKIILLIIVASLGCVKKKFQVPSKDTQSVDASASAIVSQDESINQELADSRAARLVDWAQTEMLVKEGDGSIIIKANLQRPSKSQISLPISVSGTATSPQNFSLSSYTLSFAPNTLESSVEVKLVNDSLYSSFKTIILSLGSAKGTTPGAQGVLTISIQDDDVMPAVDFDLATQTVSESVVAAKAVIRLSTTTNQEVSIPYTLSGTAKNGIDYDSGATTSGTLLIPAGANAATINLPIINNTITEPSKTVVIQLGTPTNAGLGTNATHTLTINDDDSAPAVQFSSASQTVVENAGKITLSLQLNHQSEYPITIPLVISGTASNGLDFNISSTSVAIPAMSNSGSVTINIIDDTLVEGSENISVSIGAPINAISGTTSVHNITITDNDTVSPPVPPDPVIVGTPFVQWKSLDQSVSENVGKVTIVAELSAPSKDTITVPYFISPTSGANSITTTAPDHDLVDGYLTFPAGSLTSNLTFNVIDDTKPEGTKALIVVLQLPVNANLGLNTSHTVRISDNDTIRVSLSQKVQSITESIGSITITGVLTKPNPGPSDFIIPLISNPTSSNGAVESTDYTFTSKNLVFPVGSTSASTSVSIINNTVASVTKSFYVYLNSTTSLYPLPFERDPFNPNQMIYILDDDSASYVTWSANSYNSIEPSTLPLNVSETAGLVPVTIKLSKVASTDVIVPILIDTSSTALSSQDFILSSNSVTIPAGSTSTTFNITIIDDTTFRGDRRALLKFGTPTGAVSGIPDALSVNIREDDPYPVVQFASSEGQVMENVGMTGIPLELDRLSSSIGSSMISPSQGSAILKVDFTVSSFNVRIPAGVATFSLPLNVIDDTLSEDTEYIGLQLNEFGTRVLGSLLPVGNQSTYRLNIVDNDPLPIAQFDTSSQSVIEGSGKVIVQISLNVPVSKIVHIPFEVGGSATSGVDHNLQNNEFIIPSGATTGTIEFNVMSDTQTESEETVTITLKPNSSVALNSLNSLTVKIQDATFTPSLLAFQNTVYKLVRNNVCVSCHVSGGMASFAAFASADVNEAFNAAVPRANFMNIPSSLLVSKLVSNHQGQMALSQPMIDAITAWRDGSLSSTTTPPIVGDNLIGGTVALQDFSQFEASLDAAIGGHKLLFTSSYPSIKGSLSSDGNPNEISAPMIGGYIGTGAEFCKVMIAEVSDVTVLFNRRGFDSISGLNKFNISNSSFTTTIRTQVIQKMALMFWQRAATADEVSILNQLVSDLILSQPTISTIDLSVSICTTMAGSIDSIYN